MLDFRIICQEHSRRGWYSIVTPKLTAFAASLKARVGLDRAIAYSVLARCINIIGSTGTVLLIVHFLSPVEQGYYYALLSLVSLQAIFELGFSFVVQQLAAHESVHLECAPDGTLRGNPVAYSRLASTLQLTVRWYSRAAMVLVAILVPLGWAFFSIHRHAGDHVAWQAPWTFAAVACAATFLLTPFYSFIDGCGQVTQVAFFRMIEGAAAALAAWSMMLTHHGLYAPGMVICGQAAVGVVFLWRRRRLLAALYRYPVGEHTVSWGQEVWPFQWKIAVSWMCAYFTAQAFIPLLFSLSGPVEAGQMGMSLSITAYLSVLLLSWISTKATPFGQMIAKGRIAELDDLFFRTLRQALGLLALIAAGALGGVVLLGIVYPRLADRMVPPHVFALLLIAMTCNFVIQGLAIYLRSFKREPFLYVYLATATLAVTLVALTAHRWGTLGAAISYAVSTGCVGMLSAIAIFRRFRQRGLKCLIPQPSESLP